MFNRNNGLITYDPFRAMENFEKRFFGEPFGSFDRHFAAEFRTDIKDEGDAFVLEADLPGFDKKDIKLDINGEVLTINAVRHSEHEDKDKRGKYLCCERSYGAYSRAFDMSGIRTGDIKAKFDNGVLTLTLPKKEATLPESRTLEIE